jgi:glycosyltransferase involved in cell wall biosynthesis
MRVLILNYEYPPLGGGAGVALRYLLRGLADEPDIHVDVVTSSMNDDRVETFFPRIRLHFLAIGKTGSPHFQSNKELMTYAVRAYLYSRKLLRRQRYALVHAFFGIPCGYVAMKLGLPYVVSLRGSDVPFYNARFRTLDRLFFKRASRRIWYRAARVVANSEGLHQLALKTAPAQPIDVIYNAVDTDFFVPRSAAARRRNGLLLISTGRLIERKGFHFLIQALENLEGVTLRIIGGGNQREALEALANRLGVQVDLTGPKAREAVRDSLQAGDVFVLPSLNEGMSNAVLEAMACGLPIIATDVGGSRELVRGNGIVVERGSASALAEAIGVYLADGDLIRRHGEISRSLALSMSLSAMAGQYRSLYAEIAGGRSIGRTNFTESA